MEQTEQKLGIVERERGGGERKRNNTVVSGLKIDIDNEDRDILKEAVEDMLRKVLQINIKVKRAYSIGEKRYYVQGKNSTQSVEYVADNWGYHPLVEYSSVGPHSQIVAQIALDAASVKALRSKGSKLNIAEPVVPSRSGAQISLSSQNGGVRNNHVVQRQQHRQGFIIQSSTPQPTPEEQINIDQNLQHDLQKLVRVHQQQDHERQLESIAIQKLQQLQQLQQIQEQEQQILHKQQLQQQLELEEQQQILKEQQDREQAKLRKQQQLQEEQLLQKQQQIIEQQRLHEQEQQQRKEQQKLQEQQEQEKIQEQQQLIDEQQQIQQQNLILLQHIDGQNPNQQLPILILNQNQEDQKILIPIPPQQASLKISEHSEQQNTVQLKEEETSTVQYQTTPISSFEQQAQILLQGGAVVLQGLAGLNLNFQDQNQAPLIILQDQIINGGKPVENQNTQYETAALYENPGNKLISFNNAHEESLIDIANAGGYGSKLNVKVTHRSKPIRIFKHLVSGQDVLNINRAINQNIDGSRFESSTPSGATAIVSEYGPSSVTPNLIKQEEEIASNTVSSSTINTIIQNTENTLAKKPIIVADEESYSENTIQSTTESLSKEEEQQISVEPTVDITPRPISSRFLAPITAGIQLQSTYTESPEKSADTTTENFVVDVQKSIPFYLGKIEYYNNQANEQQDKESNFTVTATQNLQLGGFLQHPIKEHAKAPKTQAPKEGMFSQTLTSSGDQQDQVQEQGEIQATVVDKPEIQPTRVLERPVEVTKPYPVRVEVPQPYPVEVEKIVERIVQKPYPVEVRVPVQVPVQVPVPHPVQVTVEKKVAVPVEKIVEKPVPQYIPKPYPVAVQVPVPVAQAYYIPVEVPKPYPVQVTKYVNKPYAILKPYPVQLTQTIEVPVRQPVPVEVRVPHPVPPVCAINNNNYIGLVPPKLPYNSNLNNSTIEKNRKARQNFDNVRLEYGFMPPLIPSLAIDEDGNPVEKHTK
ncbi:hypothetical protein ILUMI_07999 [Ignelater luminosus]|uniref:Uncharacterized protein n=1 Tax=Ignelater luminosus TaxID=2038154 RepID=A0A8K0D2T1_IGNLU|nr:hypothetical protein ILUMI_07999 [Ignelater luminosus]